jgi:hypothetical protein
LEARREDDLITSIQSPSNAVKFQVDGINLIRLRDAEEVEPLDFIFSGANASELPVPKNLVAASYENLQCVNSLDGWSTQNTIDVLDLSGEAVPTKLLTC